MFLPQQSEGEELTPTKYRFGCGFVTTVVYEKNLKLRAPFLLAERQQASFEDGPIVVNGYNYAEYRR
jgi:hypothetical protein